MSALKGKEVERYFDFLDAQSEFHKLFNYKTVDERAVAILGGTFLEMVLEHILLAYFPEDNKEIENMIKKQPLGNFSSKIIMVFSLGLIDEVIKNDLNKIREIRNKFAHNLFASFENDDIEKLCLELEWHKIFLSPFPPKEAKALDYFQVGVNTLISHLHGIISIARGEKRQIKKSIKLKVKQL